MKSHSIDYLSIQRENFAAASEDEGGIKLIPMINSIPDESITAASG